jgi:hypothetical protein
LAAIAAEHSCSLLKTDTRQAFLYGEMGKDEKVHIRPPDWSLVARTDSRRACSSASQKHVWHETGNTTMAYAHLRMDGAARGPSDE